MKYDWEDNTEIQMTGSKGTKQEAPDNIGQDVFFRPTMSPGGRNGEYNDRYRSSENVKSAPDPQPSLNPPKYQPMFREEPKQQQKQQSQHNWDPPERRENNGKNHNMYGEKRKGTVIAGVIGAAAVLMVVILAILFWPCSHEWSGATCTSAKVCSKCNETEGAALGHNWKQVSEIDCVEAKVVSYSQCTVCNKRADQVTNQLTTLLSDDGKTFRITPIEFVKRLNAMCSSAGLKNVNCSWSDQVERTEVPGIEIRTDSGMAAMVCFYEGESIRNLNPIQAKNKDKEFAFCLMRLLLDSEYPDVEKLLSPFVQASMPSYEGDLEKVKEAITEAILGIAHCGDIAYSLNAENGVIIFDVLTVPLLT